MPSVLSVTTEILEKDVSFSQGTLPFAEKLSYLGSSGLDVGKSTPQAFNAHVSMFERFLTILCQVHMLAVYVL